jgi:hypothetical protein
VGEQAARQVARAADTTTTLWLAVHLAVVTVGCGGAGSKPAGAVKHETPADEIMRVGTVWQSTIEERGMPSPPSPVNLFSRRIESHLEFRPDQRSATEQLIVEESFELRDGGQFRCRAQDTVNTHAVFARRQGDAAVELRRPEVRLLRKCQPAGFPEPTLVLSATAARFVMIGDRLTAFEPPLEKRAYLPLE